MRADARDNRQRLMLAARDVFSERGPAAPLDEIARRAGTGIATLYRHFPDRQALMLEVVRDAIELSIEEGRLAASEEPDPFRALARYMHRVVDARTAAVIPSLLDAVPLDGEQLRQARETGRPSSRDSSTRPIRQARSAPTSPPPTSASSWSGCPACCPADSPPRPTASSATATSILCSTASARPPGRPRRSAGRRSPWPTCDGCPSQDQRGNATSRGGVRAHQAPSYRSASSSAASARSTSPLSL